MRKLIIVHGWHSSANDSFKCPNAHLHLLTTTSAPLALTTSQGVTCTIRKPAVCFPKAIVDLIMLSYPVLISINILFARVWELGRHLVVTEHGLPGYLLTSLPSTHPTGARHLTHTPTPLNLMIVVGFKIDWYGTVE